MNERFVQLIVDMQVKSDRVALDIGANHGAYTAGLAEKFKRVYAFEPHPDNILHLRPRVSTYDNVEIVQAACGLVDGVTKLYLNDNPGGHSISQRLAQEKTWGHSEDKFIDVRTVRIDTFCKDLDVGFIKCDIEGGESFIFEAARETLDRCSPKVVLEVHQSVDYPPLFALFDGLGYRWMNDRDQVVRSLEPDAHYLIERV